MGLSRETFYRYKRASEEGGVESLIDKTRQKPNLLNRVDETTEKAVLEHAIEFPAYGQLRASNELRKRGIFVSPSGIRSIWIRHKLETFKKRLKALEEQSAAQGFVLTESQLMALERKKDDDLSCGEIETAHPGYLGSQDTLKINARIDKLDKKPVVSPGKAMVAMIKTVRDVSILSWQVDKTPHLIAFAKKFNLVKA